MVELTGALRVGGLRKSFGDRRLFYIDLTVEPGAFCLVLGENGVGKSTFFRCLLGLENHGGSVRVGDGSAAGRIVGVLDQPSMYAGWTAAQNLAYLTNDATAPSTMLARRLIGTSLMRRRAGHLSTGQRKMLLLAAALLNDAPFVLLDEFANGLDQGARETFRDEVREQRERGRAFIASGHDLSAFAGLPTQVTGIIDGEFVDVTDHYLARKDLGETYATHLARNRP